MKAKTISKIGKVVAAVFIVVVFVLNAVYAWGMTAIDIILAGFALALLALPIDVSIWLDKFIELRKGGSGE